MADPVEVIAQVLHELIAFAGGARGPLSTEEMQAHHAAVADAAAPPAQEEAAPEAAPEEPDPSPSPGSDSPQTLPSGEEAPVSAMAHEENPNGI